jgi:hypothetical protein
MSQYRVTDLRGVDSVVASIQGGNELGKDAPDKRLFGVLVLLLQVPDDAS